MHRDVLLHYYGSYNLKLQHGGIFTEHMFVESVTHLMVFFSVYMMPLLWQCEALASRILLPQAIEASFWKPHSILVLG